MNTLFWGLIILMLLLAIVLLVYPLLKVRKQSLIAYKDSNLKINEEKLRELDTDLAEDRIDQEYYKSAREELDRELLVDIPEENTLTAAQHYTSVANKHPATALMITIFVPMLALLLYLKLGMHDASEESFVVNQQKMQQLGQKSQESGSVEELARQLEARITEKGGTPEEWTMLARAHKFMGRNDLAAKAFAVALESDSDNAQLMLEAAEVIALSNNRVFTPEAQALVSKAYSLEPENANVLWFAGVAEYQQGNYRSSIEHLTKLLPMAGGEEEVMKSIVSIVAKSRQQLIKAGEKMPELEVLLGVPAMVDASSTKVSSTTTQPVSATTLEVTVNIDARVREKYAKDDSVFIYAKAKQGPRMPLAVQRLMLSDLPVTVTLDDSMAMVEGMNLSAFDQLVVSARITKSGSAIAQSGDHIGSAEINTESDSKIIDIVIDQVVP